MSYTHFARLTGAVVEDILTSPRENYTAYNRTPSPLKGTIMENSIVPTLTVFEKPSLQDQVIAAAVGTVATVVVTVILSAAASSLQKAILKRTLKKLDAIPADPSTD